MTIVAVMPARSKTIDGAFVRKTWMSFVWWSRVLKVLNIRAMRVEVVSICGETRQGNVASR